jgi:[ribosomal protein S5]-alanine N-acetyltransferase
MNIEILETQRLYLRKLTDESYAYILETGSAEEIMRYLDLKTLEDVNKEKAKARKGFSTHNKAMLFFHLVNKETQQVVGICGFHTWYIDHNRAEIFYHITDESLKAKGIMTEAMTQIIDYGFTKMKLNRIEAFIAPDNTPSLKLANKFGFTNEGLLRNHYLKDGIYEDSAVYSLLANEYFDSGK